MLPVHILNQIIVNDEERRVVAHSLNVERRLMRWQSDPFAYTDNYFVDLFRLTKDMVHHLFEMLIPFLQRTSSLAVSPQQRILSTLYFYATGSYQRTVGTSHIFPMSQQLMSVCVNEVSELIVTHLAPQFIVFPSEAAEIQRIKARFMQGTQFPGVIGAIDCTHVSILAPAVEEHNYVNRKGYHSKNVQLICDYDLKILNVNARYAGASHDAFIWRNSAVCAELERRYLAGNANTWFWGDAGYPLQPWLMTPIADAVPGTAEFRYTQAHARARSCIERCNGVLKARFRCLSGERKLRYKPETVAKIVTACVVLHKYVC